MKIIVADVTPPAQRRAAAGGGKLAAAVAWPEERTYEEDQMKKIWEHNRVGGAKFYHLMRSMFIGITRDRITEWVHAQGAYATTMQGGGGALMGYVTQPIIVSEPRVQQAIDLTFIPKNQTTRGQTYNFASESTHYYVAVLIDVFSKFVWIRLIQNKEADTVTHAVMKIWREYGAPKHLQSDRGSEFLGTFERMCTLYQVQRHYCAAYNSPCNGVVERVNRTIKDLISRKDGQDKINQEYLDRLAFNINNTEHAATGKTPMETHMQVRMTRDNMLAMMNPDKYVFHARYDTGYNHHPLFNVQSHIDLMAGDKEREMSPADDNRIWTVSLALKVNASTLARDMAAQQYQIYLKKEDNHYTAYIRIKKGEDSPLPLVLIQPVDLKGYYEKDKYYDHSRFYDTNDIAIEHNPHQKCEFSGYVPSPGYHLTQLPFDSKPYRAPLLAALHMPGTQKYVWAIRKDYTEWYKEHNKSWDEKKFILKENEIFRSLPEPSTLSTLSSIPTDLLLDTYVSQRTNPSDEKAKELFNIIVGEKTQNTRINTNLDEFKLQTLIDNHQEAIQEMSLGGIKLKSVLELRQKVDQWLRAQMKAMDEAKNNTKPEAVQKIQREINSLRASLGILASPEFITERLHYIDHPFSTSDNSVWEELSKERKPSVVWAACNKRERKTFMDTLNLSTVSDFQEAIKTDFGKANTKGDKTLTDMYNTYANAIKDPDKRQLYGYTNNKMAAAVTLAIREYVNRKGAQFPVVTQLGGGGGGGGSGDACTLESCPSSRQLAQKDEKKYDKVETWFNAVQMAGPTNLRQLVTAYNKHQEKKLDLTSIENNHDMQEQLFLWSQQGDGLQLLRQDEGRARELAKYNDMKKTHTDAVARQGIVKQARAMLGRVARKLAPVDVNAVVRVSLYALNNDSQDDRNAMRQKAKSFQACQQMDATERPSTASAWTTRSPRTQPSTT